MTYNPNFITKLVTTLAILPIFATPAPAQAAGDARRRAPRGGGGGGGGWGGRAAPLGLSAAGALASYRPCVS